MHDRYEGGCLCGAIRYAIAGAPLWVNLCYCTSCRKASGAPVMAFARIAAGDFSMHSGAPVRFASSPDVFRSFCGTCGTTLLVNGKHLADDTVIAVATLDRPEGLRPTTNVHTADRLDWMIPLPELQEWRGDDGRPKP